MDCKFVITSFLSIILLIFLTSITFCSFSKFTLSFSILWLHVHCVLWCNSAITLLYAILCFIIFWLIYSCFSLIFFLFSFSCTSIGMVLRRQCKLRRSRWWMSFWWSKRKRSSGWRMSSPITWTSFWISRSRRKLGLGIFARRTVGKYQEPHFIYLTKNLRQVYKYNRDVQDLYHKNYSVAFIVFPYMN